MDDKYQLQTHFAYCGSVGDYFYLHNFYDGELMRMDKKTGVMRFLNNSTKNKYFGGALNHLDVDGYIYMVQYSLRYLMRYDVANDRTDYWDLPCVYYTPTRPNGSLSTVYNGAIYIFPVFDKYIYVFDLAKNEVVNKIELELKTETTAVPFDEKAETGNIKPRKAVFSKGIRIKDDVWLFPETGCEVVCFSLNSGEVKTYFLPEHDNPYLDMNYHDDRFYLLNGTGKLSEWIPGGDVNTILDDRKDSKSFMRMATTDKNIWFLPNADGDIEVYDKSTKEFGSCPFYPEDFEYVRFYPGQSLFYINCEDEDWYYFSMCAENYMLWINKRTGEPHWLKPTPPSVTERMRMRMRYDKLMVEVNGLYALDTWLNALSNLEFEREEKNTSAVGGKIYDVVRGGKKS